jgi:hypothetical protein
MAHYAGFSQDMARLNVLGESPLFVRLNVGGSVRLACYGSHGFAGLQDQQGGDAGNWNQESRDGEGNEKSHHREAANPRTAALVSRLHFFLPRNLPQR